MGIKEEIVDYYLKSINSGDALSQTRSATTGKMVYAYEFGVLEKASYVFLKEAFKKSEKYYVLAETYEQDILIEVATSERIIRIKELRKERERIVSEVLKKQMEGLNNSEVFILRENPSLFCNLFFPEAMNKEKTSSYRELEILDEDIFALYPEDPDDIF